MRTDLRLRTRSFFVAAVAAATFAGACSFIVDGRIEENAVVDCAVEEDGVSCGYFTICRNGLCIGSTCGDGIIDTASGEECEDGNTVAGDGCEPLNCTHTCDVDEDCVNPEDPCGELGTCSEDHTCLPGGLPPDGTVSCEVEGGDGLEGVCRKGECAPPGCGDGDLDFGEECDDDTPGCAGHCQFVCETDPECDDGNVCTGTESCDVSTHTCSTTGALDCDDEDPCSADSCDPVSGCAHALIDEDGDLHAPATCGPGSELLGDDCDDENPNRNPSLAEVCHNEVDDDCDDVVDDVEDPITWYPDADGDTYPSNASALADCQDPNDTDPTLTVDYIQPRLDGQGVPQWDCMDALANVRPGAAAQPGLYCTDGEYIEPCPVGASCFFYCPGGGSLSADFNCDGDEERIYTALHSVMCCAAGWADSSPPSCGYTEQYTSSSSFNCFPCCQMQGLTSANGNKACSWVTSPLPQLCR